MAKPALLDSAAWVAAVERSTDLGTLRETVRDHARPLGYDRFVLYSAAAAHDGIVDQLYWIEGDWFGDGQDVDAATYLARCPVTRHILETDEPFFWSKTGSPGAETYRVVRAPRGPGIHGLQVPIFGPAGLSGAMSFGGTTIDSSIATRLTLTLVGAAALRSAKRMSGIRVQSEPRRLTKREREVIRWIASGRKQADAAILLGLSERTVENHLRRIRKRLGVANTAQAIQVSMQRGELDG